MSAPASAPRPAEPAAARLDLGTCVVRAVAMLRVQQLVTGEIPTYRRIVEGGKLYAPSPFMSAMVHDALACLDPRSHEVQPAALRGLSPAERRVVLDTVGIVRARIRRFLAWQEEADGTWCFYGRGSALDPDAATTACAALALDGAAPTGVARAERWRRHARALARFRASDGRYSTFVARDGRGYGWIGDDGRKLTGFDRIVNAHVLRFLAAAGAHDGALAAWLRAEAESGDRERGSPEHPDPVCFAHAVARAWTALPDAGRVAVALVPWLLARQHDDGGFGGPLSTAQATLALVDLGYDGEALDRAAGRLLATVSASGEWGYEPYLARGHGSAPFTTALALAALVGCASSRGGVG